MLSLVSQQLQCVARLATGKSTAQEETDADLVNSSLALNLLARMLAKRSLSVFT